MYNTLEQLAAAAADMPLHEAVIADEAALTGAKPEEIFEEMRARWRVMRESVHLALDAPQPMHPALIAGQAQRQAVYAKGATLAGGALNDMMARALSASEVNASMGRICAAPTAGACGVLPAALSFAAQRTGAGEDAVVGALLVASGVGAVITRNATVSGAEGGCQAECGAAAAMAAAGAAYLAHGTPEACIHAAAIALVNCMGLICDPVAGLVQFPCSFRNASQSVNAILSADLALAGQRSVIPPDEVVDAMYRTGRALPASMRETAEGGVAATRTGRRISKEL